MSKKKYKHVELSDTETRESLAKNSQIKKNEISSKEAQELKISDTSENIEFSVAITSTSNYIVQVSLKQGYTTDEAVVISKAQNAYQKNAILPKSIIRTSGSCNYIIS